MESRHSGRSASRQSVNRRLRVETLEDRAVPAYADFELSTLLPANGGNGTNGFVIDGTDNNKKLGIPAKGYQPLGDVNQDGVNDFLLVSGGNSSIGQIAQIYLIFGRSGGFPADLDLLTLDGTNGYVIDSAQVGDGAGALSSGAGDINHDGFPDIAIGAHLGTPSVDRVRAGQTFLVYGGLAHLTQFDLADGTQDGHCSLASLNGTDGFVINGVAAENYAADARAAGDVNGDHVDDLVIGASNTSLNGIGTVYVVLGRDSTTGPSFPAIVELSTLNGVNGFAVAGLDTGAMLSVSFCGGSDVNGDGKSDLVLGAPRADPLGRTDAGQVHVIFGQSTFSATFNLASLNGSNGFTIYGKTATDNMGTLAGAAGDVNGDGIDDLMMDARWLFGPNGGEVYVIFGKNTPFSSVLEISALNGSNDLAMTGVGALESRTPSAAGDVNGDGFDDLIIGVSAADPNGITNAGQSYVVYGRSSFGPNFQLSSLLAANGGDGSLGYVLNGFAPSTTSSSSAFVAGIGDINHDGFADVRIGSVNADSNGLTDNGQVYVVYGKVSPSLVAKFYVVNDAAQDKSFEYSAGGGSVETYGLNSGNTAPRGAASTIAGDKTWVVDANRKVYVYNTSGGLLGSWTAGTLPTNATVEGITVNGADIWIVDAQTDKVYRYTGAATRLSGSQNAASSFSLNGSNTSPKDLVTDGTSIWVVNDSSTDKVFKYSVAGSLQGSWTISTSGVSSPTGITINPANVSDVWIVDNGTDTVYQYTNAASRTSGNQSAAVSFSLAAGNTNPQGIADPPPASFAKAVPQPWTLPLAVDFSGIGGNDSFRTLNTIWLDDNAGRSWFVDPTPGNDSEFTSPGNQGEHHKIDLLTTLMHEVGHLLGHDHAGDAVTQESLGADVRPTLHGAYVGDADLDLVDSRRFAARLRR